MSFWTYISGTIEVDVPGRTQAEIDYILTTILDHLPRVSGSEGDMEVYVNKREGHNYSSSADEYGYRTNNMIDSYGFKDRDHGWLRKQTLYVLTVKGSLRDCIFHKTHREFMNWLCRLAKRLEVHSVLVRIHGDCGRGDRITIDTYGWENPYRQMYEKPSWASKDREPCWWEHLMWSPFTGDRLPLSMIVKYFKDQDADAAWEAMHKEEEGDEK